MRSGFVLPPHSQGLCLDVLNVGGVVRAAVDADSLAVAQAVEDGVTKKRPWYEPSEKLPDEPVIAADRQMEFDSLVVEQPAEQRHPKPRAVE